MLILPVFCQLAFGVAVLDVAHSARADAPDECADAYERAQSDRLKHSLLSARDSARTCVRVCPETLAADCAQWDTELSKDIPSVRLVVVDSRGVGVDNAHVTVDGAPLPDHTELELEPGEHTARAELGSQHADLEFQTDRGRRGLVLKLTLDLPRSQLVTAGKDPATNESSPRATWVSYALLTGGVAGLGAGAALSLAGHLEVHHLEQTCSPYCSQQSVDRVRALWWLGGGAAVLGAASFTAAWLTWPVKAGATLQVGLGSLALSSSF